jgi:VanZ family protein
MLSNPREALGPTKSSLYWLTMALLALGSLAAGLATFSSYQKNPKARAIIAALVPIFVCAWLVAYFSSSTGAGGHMIEWFIRHLSMDRASAQRLSFAVRKSIHFLFYGLFGLFAYRAASKGGIRNSVLAGVAFSVFHAAFDELRQAGYADRTGSFWDVLLDLSGAVVFVLCAAFLRQARDPSKARR